MTTLPRTHAPTTTSPRYGSPAEIAAFLGLSTKTIRRQIDSGAVPCYRVGRRVLIAFRDADQFVRRARIMSIAPPPSTFDARGRALPLSAEDLRRRAEEAIRGLDALDAIGDDQEQRETLEYLERAVNEDRLSDRRRFD